VVQNHIPAPPATRDIASSPEYQHLLALFPQLRDQLRQIYTTTLEPTAEEVEARAHHHDRFKRGGRGGRGSGRARYNAGRPWTREKGMKDGLYALRKMRAKDGRNGEALRAFSECVVRLQGGGGEEEGRGVDGQVA